MSATSRSDAAQPGLPNDDLRIAADVLRTEIRGLDMLIAQLDDSFSQVLDRIIGLTGRLIVTGMGKSGHVGKKMAATFASTGTPSFFLHPAEASHGDLGMVTRGDMVLALSNKGEAPEMRDILTYCKLFRIPLVGMTSRPQSTLALQCDHVLLLPQAPEACPNQQAPTTSTTMTLALGDALAVALMHRRNFTVSDFKNFHPGGSLGGKLVKVDALMRQNTETEQALPLVTPDMTIAEVLPVMSHPHEFGVWGRAVVVDQDKNLQGYFSDGDIRRNALLPHLHAQPVAALMHLTPATIDVNAMAASALAVMNEKRITELVVLDGRQVRGIIRLHDILAAGITV